LEYVFVHNDNMETCSSFAFPIVVTGQSNVTVESSKQLRRLSELT
jgi:hypothetical protein